MAFKDNSILFSVLFELQIDHLCSMFAIEQPGMVARSDARPPGMRTVTGSILTSGSILLWRLVMK